MRTVSFYCLFSYFNIISNHKIHHLLDFEKVRKLMIWIEGLLIQNFYSLIFFFKNIEFIINHSKKKLRNLCNNKNAFKSELQPRKIN